MTNREDSKYTVIIADDHALVRAGISNALSKPGVIEENGLNVIAEAANGIEAIELVKNQNPDLLILDVSMPLASGTEILTDVQRWSPNTKIVIMTAVTSPGLLSGLVETGVNGLFSKASDNAEFFAKLPLILRGGRYIAEPILEIIRNSNPVPVLTDRERQTPNMIVAGKSNIEIADLMGISPRTAEKHRSSLMAKLGVKSAVELMSRALKDGLIEQQEL